MSDDRKQHEENLKKEFAKAEGLDTPEATDVPSTEQTKESKITNLGKVDPKRGMGLTDPDDPEIKRLQSLVGYTKVDLDYLPSGGRFYRSDFELHIRPARVGEIRDFSTVDEASMLDVDDKLNQIVMNCCKVQYGKNIGSFKDLLEEDRLYMILMIRELTFKEGEARLMLNAKRNRKDKGTGCEQCDNTKIELRTENLSFEEEKELVAKYYDPTNRCFTVATKSYGELVMAPPTIGVMRAITDYIRKKEEEGKSWDKSSLQLLPYLQREWRGWSEKDIFSAITSFQGWDSKKFALIFRLAENMKVGVKPELKQICEGCGTEVLAPLEFPGGIKSLFVVSDISDELL